MLSKSHLKRALAPTIVTGLLTTTALAVATPAAALDSSPLAAVAPAATAISSPAGAIVRQSAGAAEAAPKSQPERVPSQSIVDGVHLKAKPPPWVLPVEGYHITGEFGDSSGLWSSTHTGLDFAADEGAELRAIGPGEVVSTESDGSFGNKTVVKLDDGTVLWYCHQSEFGAEPGQRLAPGDLVGYLGSTGNVTGPHLHLEVHRGGKPIDPAVWLTEHELQP